MTIVEEIPRLLVKSWYPWNAMSGGAYYFSLVFQIYYVFFSLMHANLLDSLFCSWLIFACEQLQHLKEIMKPLMVSTQSQIFYCFIYACWTTGNASAYRSKLIAFFRKRNFIKINSILQSSPINIYADALFFFNSKQICTGSKLKYVFPLF